MLTARTSNSTAAPNLSGVTIFVLGGTPAYTSLLGVKLVATGGSAAADNGSWDVYLGTAAYAYGTYTVSVQSRDSWTNSDTLSSDPGAASSTVAVGGIYRVIDALGGMAPQELTIMAGIANAPGYQVVTTPGCAIASGAAGNSCTGAVTWPVPAANGYIGHCTLNMPVVPLADMTVAGNGAGATVLNTRGRSPAHYRLLLPGDALQLGYRLHRVLDVVDSDAAGHAALTVWPSLRELPADGEPLVLRNPQGLWRLGSNKRTRSSDYTRVSHISFQIMEYR